MKLSLEGNYRASSYSAWHFSHLSMNKGFIKASCEARVGMLGNPSDGFGGKTLSFLLGNFQAQVELIKEDEPSFSFKGALLSGKIVNFKTILEFRDFVGQEKWYQKLGPDEDGGITLCMATFSMFIKALDGVGKTDSIISSGFSISYTTSIPRCVGLSGSSAIIMSCWKCLMSFYNLTLDDLAITKQYLPSLIMEIERRELGIAAGLQYRVIQSYRGLVHMDFSIDNSTDNNTNPLVDTLERPGLYTPIDPLLLPDMYLLYNTIAGGNSGGVHSTVKERWANKDPDLIAAMQKFGSLADEAVEALQERDNVRLASLFESNFRNRRNTYGDDVVGALNVQVATVAKDLGLSVKFSGSGGAFIGLRSDGGGFFDVEREEQVRTELESLGFAIVRVTLPDDFS